MAERDTDADARAYAESSAQGHADAVSVARGVAVLAILAALALALQATLTRTRGGADTSANASIGPACRVPVAIVDGDGERLGCGDEPDLRACPPLAAGDRVRQSGGTCLREPGGMSAGARLIVGEKLDLNRASAQDLELLDGIGPHLAAAIVAARAQRGRFSSLAELDQVPGIGPVLLGKLGAEVTIQP